MLLQTIKVWYTAVKYCPATITHTHSHHSHLDYN